MNSKKQKFKKVLVANRGEIALRAVEACKNLGLKSVAVYSSADKTSRHALSADESICIGPAPSSKSYLLQETLVHTAIMTQCDAVYPGYGFLSENGGFADLCEKNNLKFIGPSSTVMRKMGDKASARQIAIENDVPVVDGSDGAFSTLEEILREAESIPFPLLLKASAGGGGRGMQIVHDKESLNHAFIRCNAEAKSAFGNGSIYIERYFSDIRHIEVQILGDGNGGAIALGERDCSVQRRHQKLIEEAPASILNDTTRTALHHTAELLASGVNYEGAGTVEFIFDPISKEFFFIEMNTRIQVEHPVTEMLFGVNLVQAQLSLAQGSSLNLIARRKKPQGHAIEFRINAEDWEDNFIPSPGTLTFWRPPKLAGVRTDTAMYEGYTVVPFYDSLIAKLIVHGQDRDAAISKAKKALESFEISGVKTTLGFHETVISDKAFLANKTSTRWVDETFMGDTS